MALTRIMFIRHAEKAGEGNGEHGVTAKGSIDDHSLTPRGWQRAGALVGLLSSPDRTDLGVPDVIYAAATNEQSKSHRPIETATPLVEFLRQQAPIPFVTSFQKDHHAEVVADLESRSGIALLFWEHKEIPKLIATICGEPLTPTKWANDRYDIVWILDRNEAGWSFRQTPQLLLPGDSDVVIS